MKRLTVALVLAIVLGGCADPLRGMRALPPGQPVTTTPPSGKVAIVFLRPSAPGYSASLFDLKKDGDVFVGLVLMEAKLLYLTDPGPARFMVVGQRSADFMDAELEAGKTYHVVVTPGAASGTAFSLWPVTSVDEKDLPGWLQYCAWIENTPRTEAWAKAHWTSIQTRKRQFLGKWEAQSNRPTLRAADGR